MKKLKTLLAFAALLPVLAAAQSVDHRQHDQRERIEQGVRRGSLTRHEAAVIRAREAVVRAQERRDRLTHHGRLTAKERGRLNHELSRDSRDIYKQKHDAQHRH